DGGGVDADGAAAADGNDSAPTGAGDGGATCSADAGNTGVLGPIAGTPLATFELTLEGFALDDFRDPANTNLGDPLSGLAQATLVEDTTQGSPTPGCLRIDAPFSGDSQHVEVQKAVAQPEDWSGDILRVRVRVACGAFSGGAQLYVSTTPSGAY